ATGTVGAPAPTTPLPMPIGWGEAAIADTWLFVAGGRSAAVGAGGTTTVLAPPLAAGAVGPGAPAAALPVPRTNPAMVRVLGLLVLTGGANTGGGDATVLTARVRYAPDLTQPQ